MRYDEARDKMKTGDAIAVSGGNWTSWYGIKVMLVRLFGGAPSETSHMAMLWVENGRVFIMEAVATGVRLMPLSKDLPVEWIPRPKPLSQGALNWAFAHIGTAYPAQWKMALAQLLRLLGLDKHFDIGMCADGRLDCCEYVLGILSADGETLDCAPTPYEVRKAIVRKWGGTVVFVED